MRKKKGIVDQRTTEDGLSDEKSKTQRKDIENREPLRIQIDSYQYTLNEE